MKKERLDDVLVDRGFYENREAAKRAVIAGEVLVGDERAQSAAALVAPDAELRVKERLAYVSRGGYKLKAALDTFGQTVEGLCCCDIGSSTGGFSDCLLQAGAAQVSCVDVNYGELAWKLRSDPRVRVCERTNIRTAAPEDIGAPFDLLVADLSFIGLASLAPVFANLVVPGGVFIGLVKPQFESAHDETEAGLVVDTAVRERTVREVCEALEREGFAVSGCIESPVPGKKKGNIEYLVRAVFASEKPSLP